MKFETNDRLGFTKLDATLIEYLLTNGFEEKNCTVSPLSFKAALALTALGAEGETQRQILDVLGFETVEEMTAWYASVLAGVAAFDERISGKDREICEYRVVNAIFHNTCCDGEFRESYRALAEKQLDAAAYSHSADKITKAVNDWVREQTAGMIPSIVEDVSESAAVLINALYLKSQWTESFRDSPLKEFTTFIGDTVEKEFIQRTAKFRYYEDETCQLVALPLKGGVSMAVLLGDGRDLSDKLSAAVSREVRVTMPKFEVETFLCRKELVNFLIAMGCGKLFARDGSAEFDPMFTKDIYVENILQKAKVKVDEKGLEAAAATAVIMTRTMAFFRQEEPVEFTADHPFQFVIFREDAAPELLFWGQIVG